LKQIEWEPKGHSSTNEGPHVTVQVREHIKDRWRTIEKVFIEGHEKFRGNQ